jgi:hypothetical protein
MKFLLELFNGEVLSPTFYSHALEIFHMPSIIITSINSMMTLLLLNLFFRGRKYRICHILTAQIEIRIKQFQIRYNLIFFNSIYFSYLNPIKINFISNLKHNSFLVIIDQSQFCLPLNNFTYLVIFTHKLFVSQF